MGLTFQYLFSLTFFYYFLKLMSKLNETPNGGWREYNFSSLPTNSFIVPPAIRSLGLPF